MSLTYNHNEGVKNMALKTNKSDVIANFVRYHGRQPNSDEFKKGGLIDFLTSKSPAEVESRLAKNSPITGGKLWSDYNKPINRSTIAPTPAKMPVINQPLSPAAPVSAPATSTAPTAPATASPAAGITIPSTASLLTPAQLTYLQGQGITENDLVRDDTKIYLKDAVSGPFAIKLRSFDSQIPATNLPGGVLNNIITGETTLPTNLNTTPLGKSGVNALFKQYYGRDASVEELAYWENKSDAELRPKLIPNSAIELARNKQTIPVPAQAPTQAKVAPTAVVSKKTDSKKPTASAAPLAPTFLPKDVADKYYQAYGKMPGNQDVTLWQNYPELFVKQLDDLIATKNINKPGDTGTPIFASNQGALIKFSEDPDGAGPQNTSTIYWADPATKTLRPILSEDAFKAYYGITVQQAMTNKQINTVSMAALQEGGSLAGFQPLTNDYGVQNDGTFKPYEPGVDTNAATARYGKEPIDRQTLINDVIKPLEGVLTALKNDPKSGVTPALIDEIMNNQDLMLKYTSALAYGGYWLPDIYRDIKRQQLVKDGRTDLANAKVIDENKNADIFYSSPEGSAIRTNPDLTPPAYIGNLDMGLLNNPIFSIPSEIYKTLVPPFDPTTPEGKAELESIKAAWYDVQSQIANAQTDQAHEVARYNYLQFQKELNQNYGITLSDNANEAWNQIDALGNTAQQRGLSESGVMNEATDKYLQDRRKADERLRGEKLTKEQEQKRQYLLQSGTPEEINALSPAEKARYGFQPSSEAKLFFEDENLKKLYPDLSDEERNNYRNMILDENGNYRSTLYQTLIDKKYGTYENPNGIEVNKRKFQQGAFIVDPVTGRVKEGYGVLYKRALDEERKYLPYTKADAFSKPYDSGASSASQTTPPPVLSSSAISTNPPTGATLISGPSGLRGLTENQIWRDPKSNRIYKIQPSQQYQVKPAEISNITQPNQTFRGMTVKPAEMPKPSTSMIWETPNGSTFDLRKYTKLTGQEATNWANSQELLKGGKLKATAF